MFELKSQDDEISTENLCIIYFELLIKWLKLVNSNFLLMEKGSISNIKLSEFEELFRYYHPRLKRYAEYFLKDPDEAEDLVQDVFFQIWQEPDRVDSKRNISAYIFTLLKNKCLNVLKRQVVKEKYLLSTVNFPSEELYQLSFDADGKFLPMQELLQNELNKLITEMPKKCGVVFRLKWIEGKKNREIAEIMNISTTMVDKHISKGLAIAKRKLSPDLFILFQVFIESNR